jgi:hypothetical protein
MIRHIVCWKLKDGDEAAQAQAFAEIEGALTALPAVVPQIRALTVGRNIAYPEKNFDVVLVADFDSLDDLDAYQVSPAHLEAGAVVATRVVARAAVDFEL